MSLTEAGEMLSEAHPILLQPPSDSFQARKTLVWPKSSFGVSVKCCGKIWMNFGVSPLFVEGFAGERLFCGRIELLTESTYFLSLLFVIVWRYSVQATRHSIISPRRSLKNGCSGAGWCEEPRHGPWNRGMCVQLPNCVWLFAAPRIMCPPGSSVHGVPQARILQWVAVPSSRGSLPPRDWTRVSCINWRRKWQPTPVFLPGESHG